MLNRTIAIAMIAAMASPVLAAPAVMAKSAETTAAAEAAKAAKPGGGEIEAENVREIGAKVAAIAFDSRTNLAYQRNGDGSDGSVTYMFEGGDAFDAFKPIHKFELEKANIAGTYMVAQDVRLLGAARVEKDSAGSAVGQWIGKDGQLEAFRDSLPDIGGKGASTLDWGGFTAVNWLQDNTGTYVLGSANESVWVLFKMKGLEIETARKFEAKSLGFAFMLDGTLFTGSTSKEAVVDRAFNFERNEQFDVKYAFTNILGGETLITGTAYDINRDRLYLTDSAKGVLFAVNGASKQFAGYTGSGGLAGAVPEPASWAMLIAGFGLVGALGRRKRRQARAAIAA